jgi:hypothetical protein
MYKATRDFLAARQRHTEFKLQTPSVKRISGGEANKCFENAMAVVERGKAEGVRYVALSGWLVQPYDKEKNCTAIIQHWWNGDGTGNQFDTSPLINDNEEYVLDFGLYEFIRANFEQIKSNVAMSLLYQDGNYELLVNEATMEFKPLPELRTEYLFRYEQASN